MYSKKSSRRSTRDTSSPLMRYLPLVGALLLAALLVGLGSGQAKTSDAAAQPAVKDVLSLRFEGVIKAQSPVKWIINEQSVFITRQTAIIEKYGRAEVGAWVTVGAHRDDAGGLYADLILVERAAGQANPTVQFTGRLEGKSGSNWQVDGKWVKITFATTIPEAPEIKDLIRVTAEPQGEELWATNIELIARAGSQAPVEFEGIIQSIVGDTWQVDGRLVSITSATKVSGQPAVGKNAEIRAVRSGGRLTATAVMINDGSTEVTLSALVASIFSEGSGVETWDTIVFLEQLWSNPVPMTVYVSKNTLVDERRAIAKPGQFAQVTGTPINSSKVQADLIQLDQPPVIKVSGSVERRPNSGQLTGWWQIGGRPIWVAEQNAIPEASGQGSVTVEGILLGNGVVWVGPLPGQPNGGK